MDVFVFGYGSLTSRASAEVTLGRVLRPAEDGPWGAVLRGHRADWIVGSDRESHPEREFRRADGSVFEGCVAVLGLRAEPKAETLGAVLRVRPDEDLPPLRRRERNYDLADVTDLVTWPGRPAACLVHTFMPKAAALERLERATERAVRAGYVETVRQGLEALGNKGTECFLRLRERAEATHSVLELTSVVKSANGLPDPI